MAYVVLDGNRGGSASVQHDYRGTDPPVVCMSWYCGLRWVNCVLLWGVRMQRVSLVSLRLLRHAMHNFVILERLRSFRSAETFTANSMT